MSWRKKGGGPAALVTPPESLLVVFLVVSDFLAATTTMDVVEARNPTMPMMEEVLIVFFVNFVYIGATREDGPSMGFMTMTFFLPHTQHSAGCLLCLDAWMLTTHYTEVGIVLDNVG